MSTQVVVHPHDSTWHKQLPALCHVMLHISRCVAAVNVNKVKLVRSWVMGEEGATGFVAELDLVCVLTEADVV